MKILVDALAEEMLANIFSFLPPQVIMRLSRVSEKWSKAAKKTIIPLADFVVGSPKTHDIMRVMTTALPNLQQIKIDHLGCDGEFRFSDPFRRLSPPRLIC